MNDANNQRHDELVAWLTERGHSPDEVAKILEKVAEYDARTINESIFDSISDMTSGEILKFLDVALQNPLHPAPERLEDR